jgi:hypothetical protein
VRALSAPSAGSEGEQVLSTWHLLPRAVGERECPRVESRVPVRTHGRPSHVTCSASTTNSTLRVIASASASAAVVSSTSPRSTKACQNCEAHGRPPPGNAELRHLTERLVYARCPPALLPLRLTTEIQRVGGGPACADELPSEGKVREGVWVPCI